LSGHDDAPLWSDAGTWPVGDGIHRIPLPLPGDGLRAVNVYALEQSDGLVLIDSGWALGEARKDLETALAGLDHDLGSIRRILVTHVHRDHYELGMHLRRLFGAKLALGIGEQPALESLRANVPPEQSPMTMRLLAAGALPLLMQMQERWGAGGGPKIDWELPDEWLKDGTSVELEGRTLEVIATPGHTQGHVVFLDRADGLLFSGDHVLPHITPSIGFEQIPKRSSLSDYLASLAIVQELPDVRMLPAHGPPVATTHARIDELLEHHEDRLALSLGAVDHGASTGYEVAAVLPWTRRNQSFDDLDVFNRMLAVNETVAHLDVLVERADLTTQTLEGVVHYTTDPTG
jgi:glyoxylase-like metal-dependent hydrolase (beta-lactamase superfamily II)